MITITALDRFVLRGRDLDRSLAFYRDVLGLPIQFLEEYRGGQRPFVSVRIGNQLLDLVPDSTFDPEAGKTAGGFLHFCVGVAASTRERTVPWLKQRGGNVLQGQP